jgi:hypothetical protein
MRDIEGIEDVIQSLKPHWAAIDADFAEENARYKLLIARDHDVLGRVLKCHLVVENYLNRFLEAHYRLTDVEDVRLSFYQKARLYLTRRACGFRETRRVGVELYQK